MKHEILYHILMSLQHVNNTKISKAFNIRYSIWYTDSLLVLDNDQSFNYTIDFNALEFKTHILDKLGFIISEKFHTFDELIDIILDNQKLDIEKVLFSLI